MLRADNLRELAQGTTTQTNLEVLDLAGERVAQVDERGSLFEQLVARLGELHSLQLLRRNPARSANLLHCITQEAPRPEGTGTTQRGSRVGREGSSTAQKKTSAQPAHTLRHLRNELTPLLVCKKGQPVQPQICYKDEVRYHLRGCGPKGINPPPPPPPPPPRNHAHTMCHKVREVGAEIHVCRL
jgi:hypothetical protein